MNVSDKKLEQGPFIRELEFADMETMYRFAGNGDENLFEVESRDLFTSETFISHIQSAICRSRSAPMNRPSP